MFCKEDSILLFPHWFERREPIGCGSRWRDGGGKKGLVGGGGKGKLLFDRNEGSTWEHEKFLELNASGCTELNVFNATELHT